MDSPTPRLYPAVFILWSLWMLWGFGYETAWQRLNTRVEGVVNSSRDIPATRGPRYATEYTVRAPDGEIQVYVASGTDASLPRSMPVGTYIKKQRWRFSFEKDGQNVQDFSVTFYMAVLLAAATCLCWSTCKWYRGKQQILETKRARRNAVP